MLLLAADSPPQALHEAHSQANHPVVQPRHALCTRQISKFLLSMNTVELICPTTTLQYELICSSTQQVKLAIIICELDHKTIPCTDLKCMQEEITLSSITLHNHEVCKIMKASGIIATLVETCGKFTACGIWC